MRILVLDNYDSFTYNLVYILRELHDDVSVHRNDKIALEDVALYDKILLSPGPGIPSEAGIMQEVVRTYAPTKSILGVCLGHQGIGEVFGATLNNMADVLHGISDKVCITDPTEKLFRSLPSSFQVGRYHSWTVVTESVPDTMTITALDENNQVMALAHNSYDVRGVQFHPESVLTEHGKQMLQNWLSI
ncbi:MAG: aminodeoxychorismate/anthranilate synthase component II [Runella slithyformis]|nr:MAG: aminodeoxychorismate/anthranilate synthase component II [Runella slithyformis]TAF97597.1 MAG: aminodeoxychorismate/anthranilate synthase component II [Runella sp.]TAG22505.1 MAG: aminodeoxychorismate/anthranilate synthase component II [Cytophagales bacterium]TAG41540.1 MAG: aminodeoxychorismate/anthranilate synthase component II [Cytophagia bacterium]TAE98918.1 MAG: aminodeoxychorismate/anthranilate synthase component II [Runella slithyformis]